MDISELAANGTENFHLRSLPSDHVREDFERALRAGLSSPEKHLPCRYLYDDEGSRLFESICEQPEYYPTRCEREILDGQGDAIAAALIESGEEVEFVELGAGNSSKTSYLLHAFHRRARRTRYVPIDICADVMERGAKMLCAEMKGLEVQALAMDYDRGLALLPTFEPCGRRVIAWLGSSAGNMPRAETVAALGGLRSSLNSGDSVLLGLDFRKDKQTLELAYDDSAGVSAAFAKNLLQRVNVEFNGDFDLDAFRYSAEYHVEEGYVSMNLESTRAQRVSIADLDLTVEFAAGERLHTEDSYKYSLEELESLAQSAGLRLARHWTDEAALYGLFSLTTD